MTISYEYETEPGFRVRLYSSSLEMFGDKGIDRAVRFDFVTGGRAVGAFKLAPLPGNCGIVVSTETYIYPEYQGEGLSYPMHRAKEWIARKLGYSMMLCTVIEGNDPQIKGALKSGWVGSVAKFKNSRTGNDIELMVKRLD